MMRMAGGFLHLACFLLVSGWLASADDSRRPPHIEVQQEERTIVYNADQAETQRLECQASGIPTPEYTWIKDGNNLDLNQNHIQTVPGTGSILITLSSRDEGYYQCKASNMYGTSMSDVVFLQKSLLRDAGKVERAEIYRAAEGEYERLACNGLTSIPSVSRRWSLGTTILDPNPVSLNLDTRVKQDLEGNLHFVYVTKEDEKGESIYKCSAFNPIQRATLYGGYSSIVVENERGDGSTAMNRKPEIAYSNKKDPNTLLGGELVMQCIFKGKPVPTIRWMKLGGVLPAGNYEITDHDSTLTIKRVTLETAGTYICYGNNSMGIANQSITIDVKARPSFVQPLLSQDVTNHDDVRFTCDTSAIPEATITWLRNGEELNPDAYPDRLTLSADKRELTLLDVLKNRPGRSPDLMVLQCNASNTYGYAWGEAYLNVMEPTKITASPKDVVIDNTDAKNVTQLDFRFDCAAESDDSTPVIITWLLNGENIDLSDENIEVMENGTLRIVPTKENNGGATLTGTYTCVADNGFSKDTSSATLTLAIPDDPIVVVAMSYWWVFLLLAILILLILCCLLCYCWIRHNRGDEYDVDEKEREMGNDPEQALIDAGYQEFQRAPVKTHKGSRASLGSTTKLDASDEEQSIGDFGEWEGGKFNEDGSFIGQYTAPRN